MKRNSAGSNSRGSLGRSPAASRRGRSASPMPPVGRERQSSTPALRQRQNSASRPGSNVSGAARRTSSVGFPSIGRDGFTSNTSITSIDSRTGSSAGGRRGSRSFAGLPPALPPRGMTLKQSAMLDGWGGKSPEDVKRMFKQADVTGSGALDFDEFRELFRLLKSEFSDPELEMLYEQVDSNNNGQIEFSEFVDWAFDNSERPPPKSDYSELDVEIPMGGGGLVLGGKMGNAVVKKGVMAKIKVGWRAVAFNGEKMGPDKLAEAMKNLGRKNHFTLTFIVDDKTALNMVNKSTIAHEKMPKLRAIARRELAELLGCTDLVELENQSPEQRKEQLANPRLAQLLVEAHAVSEGAVLLGLSSGEEEARHASLFRALSDDDLDEAMEILTGDPPPDLLKRDEDGNVALHAAGNVPCCRDILSKVPDSRTLLNLDGRNPLNEQLARHPDGLPFEVVNLMLGDDPEIKREILLSCDRDGISAAMRMAPGQLAAVGLPSWDKLQEALSLDASEMLPALEQLAGKDWPGLVALHCFQDTLREGSHTARSWLRLNKIWEILARLLNGCIDRNPHCLDTAKALLKATKGPSLPPVDMRLPYRHELQELLHKLHQTSGHKIAETYDMLDGDDAQWLKDELGGDFLCDDLVPDALEAHGLHKRLHMDFRLKTGGHASSALTPDWVAESRPPLDQVYADMEKVGMLGSVRKKDAVFDMLRLGGMGEISSFAEHQDSLLLMRYYGAYMRGVCQGQQESINTTLQSAMGDVVDPGRNYFARDEAKAFSRLMEKTLARIEEINQEVLDADADLGAGSRTLLRRAPAYIADVNGATLIAETPTELRALYDQLTSNFRVLRTKNTYSSQADASDYRDLKLFLAVDSDIGEFVVEVQLILAEDYKEKKWMHMPYVFERGDLDWEYTRKGLPTEHLFREGWKLYHGIQGNMSDRDQKQAQDFLVNAAQQGHFVARGLCHREGWGSWRRDDSMAMSCYSAAIQGQVGRVEALCRMGTSYVSAVKDVAVYRRRGLELLGEAARSGEPEALFQLALQEYSHHEQKTLMQQAARLGHNRAMKRLSYDPPNGPSRRLSNLVDV